MFDVKLKFNVHINKIVIKALARSNLIIKCFCLVTQKRFSGICNVCKTYFRIRIVCLVSLLSYLYKKVESVQRRFTKRLKVLAELQYSERLAILGAETLELRRLKADLMYMYKNCVWSLRRRTWYV